MCIMCPQKNVDVSLMCFKESNCSFRVTLVTLTLTYPFIVNVPEAKAIQISKSYGKADDQFIAKTTGVNLGKKNSD